CNGSQGSAAGRYDHIRRERGQFGGISANAVGRPAVGWIQNGPRQVKQINGLRWQTVTRGNFDPQRLFGALANRITLKCRLASGRRLGMAINGGNGEGGFIPAKGRRGSPRGGSKVLAASEWKRRRGG